jgi:hypothetical protein
MRGDSLGLWIAPLPHVRLLWGPLDKNAPSGQHLRPRLEEASMTMTVTISQVAEGPRARVQESTAPIVETSASTTVRESQTQYIDVGHGAVAGELSKMEEILEYLKALYR